MSYIFRIGDSKYIDVEGNDIKYNSANCNSGIVLEQYTLQTIEKQVLPNNFKCITTNSNLFGKVTELNKLIYEDYIICNFDSIYTILMIFPLSDKEKDIDGVKAKVLYIDRNDLKIITVSVNGISTQNTVVRYINDDFPPKVILFPRNELVIFDCFYTVVGNEGISCYKVNFNKKVIEHSHRQLNIIEFPVNIDGYFVITEQVKLINDITNVSNDVSSIILSYLNIVLENW